MRTLRTLVVIVVLAVMLAPSALASPASEDRSTVQEVLATWVVEVFESVSVAVTQFLEDEEDLKGEVTANVDGDGDESGGLMDPGG